MPQIILIAAIDKNNAIGCQNKLIYHLPNDLKRFKDITTGHTVLMGRKTFESLPKGALPNRRNIVLSKSLNTAYPNTELFRSIEEALLNCKEDEMIYVIGGEQIYKATISMANLLEITEIENETKDADAFFPNIDKVIWKEKSKESHQANDNNGTFAFHYVTYTK